MISFVLPTRDRPEDLARTVSALGRLEGLSDADELIVVDNASKHPPVLPERLGNGVQTRVILRASNDGAAARNQGVKQASGDWVFMLDDDSCPVWMGGATIPELLESQPRDVGAVMADIHVPRANGRESGGLPEVFIGCGVAIRTGLFQELGGYDPAFHYYVEEYDLAARLIGAGSRVAFEPSLRVEHHKVLGGRDMNVILERLVRNNGWVAMRYAPDAEVDRELAEIRSRYLRIAENEHATEGYERGLAELDATLDQQRRTPLSSAHWDRFTGLHAARRAIAHAFDACPFERASIVCSGKNRWVVERALDEHGVGVSDTLPGPDDALVIGTMSPGPVLDAIETLRPLGRRVVAPWLPSLGAGVAGGEVFETGKA